MIHEVDEALRLLLAEHGLPGTGVELGFEAPTTDWAAKRNSPTISVFLYDIREDPSLRHSGGFEEHDNAGAVTGWQGPPHWFQLSYLVTAWTNRPQDEHRLLSEVLRCVVRHDALAARWLTGTLAELGLTESPRVGAILDEISGRAHMGSDPLSPRFMFTAKLEVKYRKNVPVGRQLKIIGRAGKSKARSAEAWAGIYDAETDELLAEVELLTIRIRLMICSIDKAEAIGLDWWKYDRHLSPGRAGSEKDFLFLNEAQAVGVDEKVNV